MGNERTLFFVKPDCDNPRIDKSTALEIILFLEDRLGGNFKRVLGMRTRKLPKRFYEEFYEHLKADWAEVLKNMASEFADKSLAIFIYEGPNIIQRVKDIAGPTRYRDNAGKDTIRAVFGNENMSYKTVVHASDKEGVEHDFSVFRKMEINSKFFLENFIY